MNFVNFVNIKTNFPCNQNQFPHQIYWSSHRMTFTIGSWNIYTIWDWAWAWAWADGFSSLLFFERVRHEPDATIWKPSNHNMKNGRLQSALSVAFRVIECNSIAINIIHKSKFKTIYKSIYWKIHFKVHTLSHSESEVKKVFVFFPKLFTLSLLRPFCIRFSFQWKSKKKLTIVT